MKRFAPFALLLVVAGSAAGQNVWPMERMDRWGTGRAALGQGAGTYTTPWIYKKLAGDTIVSHGPSIGEDDIAYYGTWVSDFLVKMDADSGDSLATFSALNFVQSSPAISSSGDAVYFHASRISSFRPPGRLYRIDPVTMDFDWFFDTDAVKVTDYDSASPILGPDGDIVIGSTTGAAWRIDDATGVPVWTQPALHGIIRTAAFSRDDTRVFISNGNRISGLNYTTGIIDWTVDLGSLAGAPAVAPNGTVIVGNGAGNIYGLNPATGGTIWTKTALGAINAAPAFSPDGLTAYVASHDWRLYAHRVTDGFKHWSFTGHHENRTAPTVAHDGRIYVFNRVGWLYAIAPDGSNIWTRNFAGGEGRGGPITIGADGTLYVGANKGNYALVMIKQVILAQMLFEALSMEIGALVSGGINEVHASDNQYASLTTTSTATLGRTDPQIRALLEVTSPYTQLDKFTIRFEGACSLGVGASQRIEMFNFSTNQYEFVDTRPASIGDSSFDIVLTTNASRFVHAGDGRIRLRASWFIPNGPRTWTARIDQVTLEDILPGWTP